MAKVLSFSYEQCFCPFNVLLVEGSSYMGLLRHLSNHVFWILKFKDRWSIWVIFCLKMFKIESKLTKCKKKSEKVVSLKKRILVIDSKSVNEQSQHFAYHSGGLFQP